MIQTTELRAYADELRANRLGLLGRVKLADLLDRLANQMDHPAIPAPQSMLLAEMRAAGYHTKDPLP